MLQNRLQLRVKQLKGHKSLTLRKIVEPSDRVNKRMFQTNINVNSVLFVHKRPSVTKQIQIAGLKQPVSKQFLIKTQKISFLKDRGSVKILNPKTQKKKQLNLKNGKKRSRSQAKKCQKCQKQTVYQPITDLFQKLQFIHETRVPQQQRLLVYVDSGNNSELIKSLFRQRGYSVQSKLSKRVNVVWTQCKMSNLYLQQRSFKDSKQFCQPDDIEAENPLTIQEDLKLSLICQAKNKPDKQRFKQLKPFFITNHLQFIEQLSSKRGLITNLSLYCKENYLPMDKIMPLSIIINDQQQFKSKQDELIQIYHWIVKPPQNTNRGYGIVVGRGIDLLKKIASLKNYRIIVQSYIRPLLYQQRKFDIRHFLLATSVAGTLRFYWSREGYVRTSSYQFEWDNNDPAIHLTNDAIQKHQPDYGKYEQGNKLSYKSLQRFLGHQKFQEITLQMKNQALLAVKSTVRKLDKHARSFNFELMGLDFMIDQNFRPMLIEVNQNPCLQMGCPVLERIMPRVVDEALRTSVDWLLRPKYFQQRVQLWSLLWKSQLKYKNENR